MVSGTNGLALTFSDGRMHMVRKSIRFYAPDPSTDQSVTWGTGPSLFGFVDPPAVEVKTGQSATTHGAGCCSWPG